MGTERVYKVFGQQVFHGAEVANDPQRGWERAREADERRNRVEASRPEERSSAEKLLYHAGVTIGTIVGAGLSFFGVRCGGDEDEKGKAAGGTEFDSWSSGDASSGPSWDANGSHGDATKAPEATAETKDGEAGETTVEPYPCYPDMDGDGQGDADATGELCTTLDAPNKVKTKLDCDDKDGTIFYDPTGILAPEKCNGKDDNCDGKIDNDAIDAPTWYKDADKDKYTDLSEENSVVVACEAPAGYVAEEDVADTDLSDCNDNDVASNPGESEICDTKDNDCDGFPDRGPGLICLSTAKVIIEGEWPNDHAGAPLSINFNGGTKAGLGLGVANHGGVGNVPVQAGGFFLFYGQTVAEMIAKGITTQTTVSLADADVEIVGEPGSRAGGSVAAGFANADACEDLAVGADGTDDDKGSTYIVHGKGAGCGSVELTTKKNGTPYQFSDVGAEGNLRGVTFFGDSQVKAVGRSVAFVDDLDNDGAHGLLIGAPGSTLPSGGAPGMGFYVPDHIVGTAASPISLCTIGFPFEEGTCESGPDELGGLQFFGHWGGALAGQVVAAGYVTGKGVTDLFFASDNYSSDNQNLEKTKGAGGVDIVPIPLGFDPDAARARFVLAPDGVPQWSPVPGDAIPDNLPNAKRLVGAQNELAGAYVLTADLNGANPGGQTLIISARTNQLMNGGMIYVFPSGSLEKAKTLANAPIRLLSTNQKTTMAAAAGNVAGKPNDGEELIVAHWAANALNNGAYILTNVAQMSALPQPLEIEETAALRFEGDETTDTAIERNYHIATMDDFDGDGLPELAIADTAAADGKGRIYLFTSTEIQANLKTGANQ